MKFMARYENEEFTFSSGEELESKLKEFNVEEVDIFFQEGESWELELFESCMIHKNEIGTWIELVSEHIETSEDAALAFYRIVHNSEPWGKVISKDLNNNGYVSSQTLRDYAMKYIKDCYGFDTIPSLFKMYFDYDSFEQDLIASGDVDVFDFDDQDWLYIS